MVTDTYREGTIKEMRKWSYEIYSTFLAERAVSISLSFTKLLEWADAMVSLTIHYPKFPPKKTLFHIHIAFSVYYGSVI